MWHVQQNCITHSLYYMFFSTIYHFHMQVTAKFTCIVQSYNYRWNVRWDKMLLPVSSKPCTVFHQIQGCHTMRKLPMHRLRMNNMVAITTHWHTTTVPYYTQLANCIQTWDSNKRHHCVLYAAHILCVRIVLRSQYCFVSWWLNRTVALHSRTSHTYRLRYCIRFRLPVTSMKNNFMHHGFRKRYNHKVSRKRVYATDTHKSN